MRVRHTQLARRVAFACGLWACLPAAAEVKPPEPVRVELATSDGIKIAAFWLDNPAPTAPAVLLLHNNGRDHHGFEPLYYRLHRDGYDVLALDLRGHGVSAKMAPEKYDLLVRRDPAVYREMVFDAEAGLRFLTAEKKIPPTKIVIIGAELGCGIGFAIMGRNPRLAGMVALSPGLNDYGFQALDLIQKYGRRPLLIIAGKKQLESGPQAIADALKNTARVQLEIWPGADVRGTAMLGQSAKIEFPIQAWLQGVLAPAR